MGKLKYLLCLIISLCITGSVYVYALKMHFLPIMAIYQVIAIFAICMYIFLAYRYNDLLGRAREKGEEADSDILLRRKKNLKLFIVLFCPFVLVVLCDYTYLLLVADNPFFQNLYNLLT